MTATLDSRLLSDGDTINFDTPGEHIIEITAEDYVGNVATETIVFDVIYDFSGFLPPIGKGNQPYNTNRTLPIKFQLSDANGNTISDAIAILSAVNMDNGETLGIGEFRYDTEEEQYIYNLMLNLLGAGQWELSANLNDGTSHTFDASVRD